MKVEHKTSLLLVIAYFLLVNEALLQGLPPIPIPCRYFPSWVIQFFDFNSCKYGYEWLYSVGFVNRGLVYILPFIAFFLVFWKGFKHLKIPKRDWGKYLTGALLIFPLLKPLLSYIGRDILLRNFPHFRGSWMHELYLVTRRRLNQLDYIRLFRYLDFGGQRFWYALCLLYFQWVMWNRVEALGFIRNRFRERVKWTLVLLGIGYVQMLILGVIWVYILRLPEKPLEISIDMSYFYLFVSLLFDTFQEEILVIFLFVHLKEWLRPCFLPYLLPGVVWAIFHADYYAGVPIDPYLSAIIILVTPVRLYVFSRTRDLVPLWASHFLWNALLIIFLFLTH